MSTPPIGPGPIAAGTPPGTPASPRVTVTPLGGATPSHLNFHVRYIKDVGVSGSATQYKLEVAFIPEADKGKPISLADHQYVELHVNSYSIPEALMMIQVAGKFHKDKTPDQIRAFYTARKEGIKMFTLKNDSGQDEVVSIEKKDPKSYGEYNYAHHGLSAEVMKEINAHSEILGRTLSRAPLTPATIQQAQVQLEQIKSPAEYKQALLSCLPQLLDECYKADDVVRAKALKLLNPVFPEAEKRLGKFFQRRIEEERAKLPPLVAPHNTPANFKLQVLHSFVTILTEEIGKLSPADQAALGAAHAGITDSQTLIQAQVKWFIENKAIKLDQDNEEKAAQKLQPKLTDVKNIQTHAATLAPKIFSLTPGEPEAAIDELNKLLLKNKKGQEFKTSVANRPSLIRRFIREKDHKLNMLNEYRLEMVKKLEKKGITVPAGLKTTITDRDPALQTFIKDYAQALLDHPTLLL